MIRLACGIENASDLIADLAQALEKGSAGSVQGSKFKVQGSTVGVQE
jgi:hypothetical protein